MTVIQLDVGMGICYCDLFSWFSSVPSDTCWNCTL